MIPSRIVSFIKKNRRGIAARFCLLFLALLLIGRGHLTAADTNALVAISLLDQWDKPAELRAPLDKVTILTVADRAGAEQIKSWVTPLKQRFSTNIEFFAVADVRAVPRPLQGFVRRHFIKAFAYPIGLDWKGSVTEQLSLHENEANLFVLDVTGHIRFSTNGNANPKSLAILQDAVTNLVRQSPTPSEGY